jgi:NitT/TauT family transport system permease protein
VSSGSRTQDAFILNGARVALTGGFVFLWWLVSGRWVDDFWISSPAKVVEYLYDGFRDGPLVHHTVVTMSEVVYGFVPGLIFGLLVGIVLAELPLLARILDPLLLAVNGIPRVALGPLLIVWFGIGMTSKVVLVFSLVFFVVFFNTFAGINNVDQSFVRIGRAMGATRAQLFSRVILPASMPWIFAGVKIAIPYALVGALVGEFIASNEGLGYLVQYSANLYNANASIALIIYLALLTMVLNELANLLFKKMWHSPETYGMTSTTAP